MKNGKDSKVGITVAVIIIIIILLLCWWWMGNRDEEVDVVVPVAQSSQTAPNYVTIAEM